MFAASKTYGIVSYLYCDSANCLRIFWSENVSRLTFYTLLPCLSVSEMV